MMRCISLWQPYATLLVRGFKRIETRPYAAPSTCINVPVGIASTKQIKPEQRAAAADPEFAAFYAETGLPPLDELPHGFLLGEATFYSTEPITKEDLDDITDEEQSYGWFAPGRHAWRTRDVVAYDDPIPVKGQQGIWFYEPPPEHLRLVPQTGQP
jgi:hypothetical protein